MTNLIFQVEIFLNSRVQLFVSLSVLLIIVSSFTPAPKLAAVKHLQFVLHILPVKADITTGRTSRPAVPKVPTQYGMPAAQIFAIFHHYLETVNISSPPFFVLLIFGILRGAFNKKRAKVGTFPCISYKLPGCHTEVNIYSMPFFISLLEAVSATTRHYYRNIIGEGVDQADL